MPVFSPTVVPIVRACRCERSNRPTQRLTASPPLWAVLAIGIGMALSAADTGVGGNLPPADHGPLEANADQILIAYTGSLGAKTTRSRDEALALAQRLAQELSHHPDRWADCVEQYSDGSRAAAGAVGAFRRGRMTPVFEAAAFGLPIGGISARPVESPYGLHLIRRTPVPAVYFARMILIAHDKAQAPPAQRPRRSAKEAADLAAGLYAQLQKDPARFRELQIRHSDDPHKAQGGFLPDFYPDRADPALVQAMAATAVGAVAPPFATRYGVVLAQRLEPVRNLPALKGFASATHLLIAYAGAEDSTATRSWLEARDLATKLAAQARQNPAQFADLVRQFSEAPDRLTGGDLGFVDLERLPPHLYEWGRALQSLPVGGIGEPVESDAGFHVLLRKELPLRLRARQILVAWSGTPAKVVRDKAAAATHAAKYLADLKQVPPADLEKAFVRAVDKYSDDGGDRGGDLGTFKPQDYFPAITAALLKTPIGGLSELVETPFGYAILLRLEPLDALPEEKNPVTLPDFSSEGRGGMRDRNPDRTGPLPERREPADNR